ncbi:MAG: hypothetical protein LH474_13155 [Chamaesiphon sp.]|nr:hypothetical protein [Chamaesiphon sp.]
MVAAQAHFPRFTPEEYFALCDYVLVSADEVAIDLYHKNESGKWEISNYIAGDAIELTSVNLTFEIEQVFEGIVFVGTKPPV